MNTIPKISVVIVLFFYYTPPTGGDGGSELLRLYQHITEIDEN
jgi:hypothetical protein